MILKEIKNNSFIIKLNRPEKRNALNKELINSLLNSLNEAENNNEVKSVIITGEGKAFCAGADLNYIKEISDYTITENSLETEELSSLFYKIFTYKKPIIAAVNGPAIAGGCGIATVCDFIFANEKYAKFGYTEVKLGFIPAIVAGYLIEKIGISNAKYLLYSGEIIDAFKAKELHLVDFLSNDLFKSIFDFTAKLHTNSLDSIILTKELINKTLNIKFAGINKLAINYNIISRYSSEFKEGIDNFFKEG